MRNYDAIIVGGGIAGLYSASRLLASTTNLRVLVLEKQGRLGGRIHTIHENGYQYEAGAGRFSTFHKKLLALLSHFGLHNIRNARAYAYSSEQDANNHDYKLDDTISEKIYGMLKQVMDVSSTMKKETLVNITFKELCVDVLGEDEAQLLQAGFGYNAEFDLMNAYDACDMFAHDFKQKVIYYSCEEGLSKLVDNLEDELLNNRNGRCTIRRATRVVKVEHTNNTSFTVQAIDASGTVIEYHSRAVIAAIPQKELLEWDIFTKQHVKILKSVVPVSLHRIYGAWLPGKDAWFNSPSSIPKTTTMNRIRQFIPVYRPAGLAMLSYSDTKDADYWKTVADKGLPSLVNTLMKYLRRMFAGIQISAPTWVQSHYWPVGVHMWKPGADSDELVPRIRHILGGDVPFFIVGEAYCKHQAWIEGTLESVDEAMPEMLAVFNDKPAQGGTNKPKSTLRQRPVAKTSHIPSQFITAHHGILTRRELEIFRKTYPELEWVLYDDEHNVTRVIDVTQWKWQHPGGSTVYDKYLYQDITSMLHNVPYHYQVGILDGFKRKMRSTVQAALDKYTIARVTN